MVRRPWKVNSIGAEFQTNCHPVETGMGIKATKCGQGKEAAKRIQW